MSTRYVCLLATSVVFCVGFTVSAQTPSFAPDTVFQSSSLSGWHPVGHAAWSASTGTITGDARTSQGSGWLILNRSYQDVGLYSQFRCGGACDTGILLHAHKTDKGTEGIFVSIQGDELGAFHVTLDASGSEIERKRLRLAGGQIRFAPPLPDDANMRSGPPRALPTPRNGPTGVTLPMTRPTPGIRRGDWNDVEILLDADLVRAFFNAGGGQVSTATEDMNGYGPFALYVGKGSRVEFRQIAY